MSQLVNLMARMKAWCEDDQIRPDGLSLKVAINCLEEHADMLDNSSDDHRKFILEQLKLTTKSKYRHHYSPQLTVFTYLPHASSTARSSSSRTSFVCPQLVHWPRSQDRSAVPTAAAADWTTLATCSSASPNSASSRGMCC